MLGAGRSRSCRRSSLLQDIATAGGAVWAIGERSPGGAPLVVTLRGATSRGCARRGTSRGSAERDLRVVAAQRLDQRNVRLARPGTPLQRAGVAHVRLVARPRVGSGRRRSCGRLGRRARARRSRRATSLPVGTGTARGGSRSCCPATPPVSSRCCARCVPFRTARSGLPASCPSGTAATASPSWRSTRPDGWRDRTCGLARGDGLLTGIVVGPSSVHPTVVGGTFNGDSGGGFETALLAQRTQHGWITRPRSGASDSRSRFTMRTCRRPTAGRGRQLRGRRVERQAAAPAPVPGVTGRLVTGRAAVTTQSWPVSRREARTTRSTPGTSWADLPTRAATRTGGERVGPVRA